MVTDRVVDAQEVGRAFAELVRNDSSVRSVWADQSRDVFTIWSLTEPISADRERELYAVVDQLHEIFPYALIEFHLINLLHYEAEPEDLVLEEMLPTTAVHIAVVE
jgi:hypothetical protein